MCKVLKIGHRGAKGYIAENTLASFQKAIDLGCDAIEMDVHLSLDQEVIVIHDKTIDRTTSGKGFVNQMTLEDLKKFQIPTLQEVISNSSQDILLNIELKSFETADKVVSIIKKCIFEKKRNYNHFIVSSFDWNALQEVKFQDENIPIGVLTDDNLDLAFSFAKFIKARTIIPLFELLNQENVTKIHSKGFEIYAWTVNQMKDIQKMKALQIDGIISDFPDRI